MERFQRVVMKFISPQGNLFRYSLSFCVLLALLPALIIFPALTSMRVFKTFKGVILNSAILSVVCLILGVTISYVYATPAGASVVVVNMAMLAVYSVIGALKNRNNGK